MSRRGYYSEARKRARDAVGGDGIGKLRPEQLAALRERTRAERERLAKKYAEAAPTSRAESPEDGR